MLRLNRFSFGLIVAGLVATGLGLLITIADRSAQSKSTIPVARSVQMTGVVFAGAEFAPDKSPGVHGRDYIYPKASGIDYFASKGMNVIRLPVLWERLQRRIGLQLDEGEMRRIDAVVKLAASKGIKVILDVHNFAAYSGSAIGSEDVPVDALGDLWRQIAQRYKNNGTVAFSLMNEPTGLQTETWLAAANIAIAQIRGTGAKNMIFVPGNGWSSARDWTVGPYGTPNSDAMLKISDPSANSVFEVHQFFDPEFTGAHANCRDANVGVESLQAFTDWARKNRKRGFLGQFGVGANQTCLDALDRVLGFMAENNDVWLGWTYWAAGAWWPKDYFASVEPLDGKDRPQMQILEKYVGVEASTGLGTK